MRKQFPVELEPGEVEVQALRSISVKQKDDHAYCLIGCPSDYPLFGKRRASPTMLDWTNVALGGKRTKSAAALQLWRTSKSGHSYRAQSTQ